MCLAFDQDELRKSFRDLSKGRPDAFAIRPYEAPVQYRTLDEASEWPTMGFSRIHASGDQLKSDIDDTFPSRVADLYFAKSWDWNTETEYRLLVHGGVYEFEYLDITRSLCGLFLGPRFPPSRIGDLRNRCRPLWDAGRVYRVSWSGAVPDVEPVTDADTGLGNEPMWKIPEPAGSAPHG